MYDGLCICTAAVTFIVPPESLASVQLTNSLKSPPVPAPPTLNVAKSLTVVTKLSNSIENQHLRLRIGRTPYNLQRLAFHNYPDKPRL